MIQPWRDSWIGLYFPSWDDTLGQSLLLNNPSVLRDLKRGVRARTGVFNEACDLSIRPGSGDYRSAVRGCSGALH